MKPRARAPALAAAIAATLSIAVASAPAKQALSPHVGGGESAFGQEAVPGEVIVRFERGASSAERADAKQEAGASLERKLLLSRTELVEVVPGGEDEAIAQLERDPNVLYAEPNAIVYEQATPNDTRFADLWGLNNTGQPVDGVAGLADRDIDAPEAWNLAAGLGSSVRVAVIDSGVVANHPDLAANMFTNPGESGSGKATNGIDDDGNGRIDDVSGWDFAYNDKNPTTSRDHGTHVAGTIAARANNGLGVAGAASFPTPSGDWLGPKIMPVKVLDEQGEGTVAQYANGLVYAGTMNAKVVNASVGLSGTSATLDNAIKSRPNSLYVVPAGNSGTSNDSSPFTPCNAASGPDATNKICVAATNSRDVLASNSNFGPVNVDLAAPGVSVLSTVPTRTVFSDDFETAIAGRWTTNDAGQTGAPRWGRTTLFSTSPTHSLTDSPGNDYANNQDNWARNTTGFNLTGGHHCRVFAQVKIDTENGFDVFSIEATRTPATASSWREVFNFDGAATGPLTPPASLPAAFDGLAGVFVRFRLNSDGSTRDDGAYVDDVAVKCRTNSFNATSYAFMSGTSMAAPHVAGAAALLFTKFPAANVAEVKNKILRSADRKASLTGRVATGARLNLYKAGAESTAAVSGGELRFIAGVGQRNNVTATRFVDNGVPKYRITDPYSAGAAQQSGSRIRPGAGCARADDTTVECPAAGITRIVLAGRDENDTLRADTIAIPVTLSGGPGADSLLGGTNGDVLIGGPGADVFAAAAGNDIVNARSQDADVAFSCGENAGDNDTVNADLTPNDPVAANPANCEVVNKA